MRTKDVKIEMDLVNAVQERQIEMESLKNLLGFAYSTTAYVVPEERIKKLEKQFMDTSAEYELLKNKVDALVVPEDFNRSKSDWNLDFSTGIVTVTEHD